MKIKIYKVLSDNGWTLAIEDTSDLNDDYHPLSIVRFNYSNDGLHGGRVMDGMWNDEYSESVREFTYLGEVELPNELAS